RPVTAQPSAPGLTNDLALIPAEALGFAHVRVAEVWKGEAMKPLWKAIERAGPAAFETLDRDFTPAPSTLERVTTVALPSSSMGMGGLRTVTVLAFSRPFEVEKVRKQYMPKGEAKVANGKAYTDDKQAGVAVHFADDRTLVFGDAETLPAFLKLKGKPAGAFAEAPTLAAGKAPLVACVNVKALPIPNELKDQLPEALQPLLKAEAITLSAETEKVVSLTLAVGFGSANDAKAGEKAVRAACDYGRRILVDPRRQAESMVNGDPARKKESGRPLDDLAGAVFGLGLLGGINTLDELLAEPPLKTSGSRVTAVMPLPTETARYLGAAVVSAGVALPAVLRVRNAAARMQSMNNLKQIGIALHSYHDAHGALPPAAICDKRGKKLLSWRVAILPYLEQNNLYKLFKLDEPWDSEHNKPLSAVAIKTFVDPRADTGQPTHTHYKVFVGGGGMFDWLAGKRFVQVTDGLSNTVMVAAAGEAVPWAKPDDFEYDPKKDVPDLKKPFGDLLVLMGDGSVRAVRPEAVQDFDKLMRLLIQADDGMPIPEF
nr:DUF1559 domain-containing protein [Fimbriiglobus sp.]